MSNWQTSVTATEQQVFGTHDARSPLDIRLVAGLATMAFGAALFGLGLFHGFENGTCSTTGYSAHYGPVPHCAKGIGWWMLILLCGIFIAIAGAAISGLAGSLLTPVMFMAVGVPFVLLALGSGNGQLLAGSSASTGRLSAGIFGGLFAVSGLVWGALAAPGSRLRAGGRSVWVAILAAALEVGLAFVIAGAVSSAIGNTTSSQLQQANQVLNQGSAGVNDGSASGGSTCPEAAATTCQMQVSLRDALATG